MRWIVFGLCLSITGVLSAQSAPEPPSCVDVLVTDDVPLRPRWREHTVLECARFVRPGDAECAAVEVSGGGRVRVKVQVRYAGRDDAELLDMSDVLFDQRPRLGALVAAELLRRLLLPARVVATSEPDPDPPAPEPPLSEVDSNTPYPTIVPELHPLGFDASSTPSTPARSVRSVRPRVSVYGSLGTRYFFAADSLAAHGEVGTQLASRGRLPYRVSLSIPAEFIQERAAWGQAALFVVGLRPGVELALTRAAHYALWFGAAAIGNLGVLTVKPEGAASVRSAHALLCIELRLSAEYAYSQTLLLMLAATAGTVPVNVRARAEERVLFEYAGAYAGLELAVGFAGL